MTNEEPTPELDISGLADRALAGKSGEPVEKLDQFDQAFLDDLRQDIDLKKRYGGWLLFLVAAQLVIADGVFVAYAWAGEDWHLSAGVIQVWLGATLVQLIGVILVVTQYLFPRRGA